MMEAVILIQGKNDPPRLTGQLPEPVINLAHIEKMTFCIVEAGMQSGEPSVVIVVSDSEGSVALQTSLDKFLTAASTMAAAAEHHWGWTRPEGHLTIMPPSREAQRAMLEAIQKELQEWENT